MLRSCRDIDEGGQDGLAREYCPCAVEDGSPESRTLSGFLTLPTSAPRQCPVWSISAENNCDINRFLGWDSGRGEEAEVCLRQSSQPLGLCQGSIPKQGLGGSHEPAYSATLEGACTKSSPKPSPYSTGQGSLQWCPNLTSHWVSSHHPPENPIVKTLRTLGCSSALSHCLSHIHLVKLYESFKVMFSSVTQSCLTFVTPWTDYSTQASLSITNSQSLLKLMSIHSVMPSNHLILLFPSLPAFNLSQHQGLFQ